MKDKEGESYQEVYLNQYDKMYSRHKKESKDSKSKMCKNSGFINNNIGNLPEN